MTVYGPNDRGRALARARRLALKKRRAYVVRAESAAPWAGWTVRPAREAAGSARHVVMIFGPDGSVRRAPPKHGGGAE